MQNKKGTCRRGDNRSPVGALRITGKEKSPQISFNLFNNEFGKSFHTFKKGQQGGISHGSHVGHSELVVETEVV